MLATMQYPRPVGAVNATAAVFRARWQTALSCPPCTAPAGSPPRRSPPRPPSSSTAAPCPGWGDEGGAGDPVGMSVVDLDGAFVTPAFVDAHVHATATG